MSEKNYIISDRFWTIPNILSISRIVMIIPIVNQLRLNTMDSNFIAFILIAVSYITDFLDGFIARATNSMSRIGQILDPIGDKLLAITVSAVLYFGGQAPLYLFVLILARDFIISMGVFYAMNAWKRIMVPLLAGKVTTFVLGVLLACYPLSHSAAGNLPFWGKVFSGIVAYGTWLACALLVFSGCVYIIDYYRNFLFKKKGS